MNDEQVNSGSYPAARSRPSNSTTFDLDVILKSRSPKIDTATHETGRF